MFGYMNAARHRDAARESLELQGREAQERALHHKGGFGDMQIGSIEGHDVTFALGWGSKEGETLLADGHFPMNDAGRAEFFRHAKSGRGPGHDHFGKGDGRYGNGTRRGRYSGPDA